MRLNDTASIRAKLATWLSRMVEARYPEFHYTLKQLWSFLCNNPVLKSLCDRLELRPPPPNHGNWEGAITPMFIRNFTSDMLFFNKEEDHYAFCYQIVKNCAMETQAHHPQDRIQIEMEFARRYHPNPALAEPAWLYGYFVNNIIRPLIIYLDEELDSSKTILAILQRYKHKCEWFQRSALNQLWTANPEKGEWVLKLHLYEYLFDNGLQFVIEPYSPLGEVDVVSHDLVVKQQGSERLIADAKLIKEGTGRKAFIDGFHQVYKYTLDYDDPFGYLIVFNACDRDVTIAGDGTQQGARYVEHNGKTVYVVTIDICPDPASASKRGRLRTVEITKQDLIEPQQEDTSGTVR